MKQLKKHLLMLPSLCFLGIVLWLCATNLGVAVSYTWQALPSGYVEYTANFEQNLSDYLVQKYDFIEMNGAMFKGLGVHTLNNIWKLKNGHLTSAGSPISTSASEPLVDTRAVESTTNLVRELEADGIGHLYVMVPEKFQFYDCDPMPGYEVTPGVLQALANSLEDHQVNHLNMDTWFEQNGWTMDDTYFRTDHHWRPEAAFAAAQQIMEFFSDAYGLIRNETMDANNWSTEIYEDWFLGSHGWRTGFQYGGVDDISFMYPNFTTDMQVGRINSQHRLHTDMQTSVYDLSQIQQPGSYDGSIYCLYWGGDYPLTYVQNPLAPNDKKLIVVGDSMRLPVECFLSTQFTELYHIDLRHYQEGTFLEYVKQIAPDLVLFLFTGTAGINQEYGLENWEQNYADKSPDHILSQEATLILPEAKSNSHYHLLEANLEPGSYQITLEHTTLNRNPEINPESPGMYQQFALVDLNTNQMLRSRFFLTDYAESQQWLFQVPDDPNACYAILAYNGTNCYTLGNAAVVTGLSLSRFQ